VETICFTNNYIKRMRNGLIQFRNAIKSCKVFRVHGTLYVGIAHNSQFLPLQ
jgi:hypothetical protein